jgi:hypothetical protein
MFFFPDFSRILSSRLNHRVWPRNTVFYLLACARWPVLPFSSNLIFGLSGRIGYGQFLILSGYHACRALHRIFILC